MRNCTFITIAAFIILMTGSIAIANENQIVAGAGPSTKIVQSFFTEFSSQPAAKGLNFEIPPKSVKHAGGIKCSDYNLFGRTGRPLNSQ